MKRLQYFLPLFLLTSCAFIESKSIEPEAQLVRIYSDFSEVKGCQLISEVIGSEGHWYNYLFISNKDLTQGAINDIKIQARSMGANAVHTHTNTYFSTSVTIFGQAYKC